MAMINNTRADSKREEEDRKFLKADTIDAHVEIEKRKKEVAILQQKQDEVQALTSKKIVKFAEQEDERDLYQERKDQIMKRPGDSKGKPDEMGMPPLEKVEFKH